MEEEKDARKGEVYESMNVGRECKTLAEEGSWSGLNQVRERARKINPGDEEGKNRFSAGDLGFVRVLKRLSGNFLFDFHEEGITIELDFSSCEDSQARGRTLLEHTGGRVSSFSVEEREEAGARPERQ